MFFDQDIKGDHSPEGVVSLTYDDGPGPHTLELARYLHDQHIQATFFVMGRHAEEYPEVLPALTTAGHQLGNHTFSHPGLVAHAQAGGDVVEELLRADASITSAHGPGPVFFRAPYGNWREKLGPDGPDRRRSLVADRLARCPQLGHCIGPVNWDIVAEDWECWRQGLSPEECARRYLAAALQVGRGIILMHDSSEEPAMQARNRTMHMTKLLVPLLRREGFRFARLDELPQVRSACQVTQQIFLHGPQGYLAPGQPGAVWGSCAAPEEAEVFGVVDNGLGEQVLRASNGLFLSLTSDRIIRPAGLSSADPRLARIAFTAEGAALLRVPEVGNLTFEHGTLRASNESVRATRFRVEPRFTGTVPGSAPQALNVLGR